MPRSNASHPRDAEIAEARQSFSLGFAGFEHEIEVEQRAPAILGDHGRAGLQAGEEAGVERFGFGARTFEVPGGRGSYRARLDVRDSLGLFVDMTAGVDVTRGEAFWSFRSIDPATGTTPLRYRKTSHRVQVPG